MPPSTRKPPAAAPDDDTSPDVPTVTRDALRSAPPRFVLLDAVSSLDSETIVLPAPPEYAALGLVRVMSNLEYAVRLAHLTAPFPHEQLEALPKQLRRDDNDKARCEPGSYASADGRVCGGWHARSVHLDYVGHAGVTMRLLEVDPLWSYRFLDADDAGRPTIDLNGTWIALTVLGMTRLGFGDAQGKSGPNATKEVIGDALRNAALRFGVATYLWSKSEESQILKAGGEVPTSEGPGPEPERPRTPRARAAAKPPADAMPITTALAYRADVLRIADTTERGAHRDAALRRIYDAVSAERGLAVGVPVPEGWRALASGDETQLGDLITGARGVDVPSGENTGRAEDDAPTDPTFDPWATPAPTDEGTAQ